MTGKIKILTTACRLLCTIVLSVTVFVLFAQKPSIKQFSIKGNEMVITLSRSLSLKEVTAFTEKYNAGGIGLHQLIGTGNPDSIKLMGWKIDASDPGIYVITKSLQSPGVVTTNSGKIIFSAVPTPDDWRVIGGNRVVYGVNRFNTGSGFTQSGDTVYFYLKNHHNARKVRLAGNFTNWQYGAFPMLKTDDGWIVPVKLKPGQYYYKFIINEEEKWITDPANELKENDGRGNENSVFYVTNRRFELKGYGDAANVFIAGNFNNWVKNDLRLQKTNSGWRIDMYLEPGSYTYNYYADGSIITGDGKDLTDKGSKLSIGDKYEFRLKGFQKANKIALAGNFNDWQPDELYMQRTADGWKIAYALGPGNYQYKFVVDGNWITDPANPAIVSDGKGHLNSLLVIGANYSFRLKGSPGAKKVNLAGDFNDWSPEGLQMQHAGDYWVYPVYLARGKHLYKFIIDGKWVRDPSNPDWEKDEEGNENSVLWIE